MHFRDNCSEGELSDLEVLGRSWRWRRMTHLMNGKKSYENAAERVGGQGAKQSWKGEQRSCQQGQKAQVGLRLSFTGLRVLCGAELGWGLI